MVGLGRRGRVELRRGSGPSANHARSNYFLYSSPCRKSPAPVTMFTLLTVCCQCFTTTLTASDGARGRKPQQCDDSVPSIKEDASIDGQSFFESITPSLHKPHRISPTKHPSSTNPTEFHPRNALPPQTPPNFTQETPSLHKPHWISPTKHPTEFHPRNTLPLQTPPNFTHEIPFLHKPRRISPTRYPFSTNPAEFHPRDTLPPQTPPNFTHETPHWISPTRHPPSTNPTEFHPRNTLPLQTPPNFTHETPRCSTETWQELTRPRTEWKKSVNSVNSSKQFGNFLLTRRFLQLWWCCTAVWKIGAYLTR